MNNVRDLHIREEISPLLDFTLNSFAREELVIILYCLNNSDFVTLLKNYELQNFPISKGTKRIKGPITKDGTG
ncbi:hypothetical protein, partial [Parafilimonas sp.]|uniref:hypothetical protein n=1 Tax=Parafilimonas sp. TaxID=1969739 RepID=UPI0039E24337